MVELRILVNSLHTDIIEQNLNKNLVISTKTSQIKPVNKMWILTKGSVNTTDTRQNARCSSEAMGCETHFKQRKQRKNSMESTSSTKALNATKIHNLATFIILVVTLYSTTLCMAQLSGK